MENVSFNTKDHPKFFLTEIHGYQNPFFIVFGGNGFVSMIDCRDNNRVPSGPRHSIKDILLEGDKKGDLLNQSENDVGSCSVKSNQSKWFPKILG